MLALQGETKSQNFGGKTFWVLLIMSFPESTETMIASYQKVTSFFPTKQNHNQPITATYSETAEPAGEVSDKNLQEEQASARKVKPRVN